VVTDGSASETPSSHWPGFAVPLVFLAVGLVTLPDYGTTWDENESLQAGLANLRILEAAVTGGELPAWPWHEIPGYQFVVDTVRAAFVRSFDGALRFLPERERPLAALHLFHLLLSTAALLLTHRLAIRVTGSSRVAVLAAAVLATTPKFFAHALTNPKDMVGLVLFVLALAALVDCFLDRARPPSRRRWWAATVTVGLAAASHVVSVFLLPLGVLIERWRSPEPVRERLRTAAALALSSGAVAFACWPWLWESPLSRSAWIVQHALQPGIHRRIFYFGELLSHGNAPWHYSFVSLAVATPWFLFVVAALGVVSALRGSTDLGRRRLARLAAVWFVLPFAVDTLAPVKYDGARHFLFVLPALALLAALGLDRLMARAGAAQSDRRSGLAARVALVGVVLLWAGAVVDLASYHPYQDAYLAPPVRFALDRPADEVFLQEYWAGTFREASRWINHDAPRAAAVYFPRGAFCADPYLRRRLRRVGTLPREPLSPEGRHYLVILVQPEYLTDFERRVRATETPAFRVERKGSRLLEVYRFGRERLAMLLARVGVERAAPRKGSPAPAV
jgi:hypothetical protein